ncbi:hypothetical protein CDAR_400751 [Caerostris darwini]|uniref:Uncharacterized protein n=1 Tax=Caerostris darwini TaxID=1538125 RepID=A0AAV4NCN4_9ARAC|nr:hypothetical protein CDAR_400751 [Caerostris darwini]
MLDWETNPYPFNPRLPLAALFVARRRADPVRECSRQTLAFTVRAVSKGISFHNRMGRKYFLATSISSCFETEARDALVIRGVYAWE